MMHETSGNIRNRHVEPFVGYVGGGRGAGGKDEKSTTGIVEDLLQKQPRFLYGNILLTSYIPPFAIMIAFGGKPTLIVLCFSALVSYIFDILGSVEVYYADKINILFISLVIDCPVILFY